jgi:glutamate 5-kinase
MKIDRKQFYDKARRVVVKVGSGLLTTENGLNTKAISAISRQISRLIDNGREVVLVSSGAMASGVRKIGLMRRPEALPKRQAVSAVGQAGLIRAYEKAFGRHGKKVAQILLTGDGLTNRVRYLNARNTLYTLLDWQVVPIINENDTVSVEEIKFGDNDNLAAVITLLMNADILVNLTNIDGLYTADPRSNPDGERIPTIASVNRKIEALASGVPGALNFGGMLSKVLAAKKVTAAGVPMVIANGHTPNVLFKLFDGADLGTFFSPQKHKLASRKCWIGYTLKPKGAVRVDDGAAAAVLRNGKSLLPTGITGVEGDFSVGAPVAVKNSRDAVLAVGLANYSAADILKIMGLKTGQVKNRLGYKPYDEVIHRDNLVVTAEVDE